MSETLPRAILERCQRWQGETALRYKVGDAYRDLSWTQLAEQVLCYGRALVKLGLEPGERVAIMAPNGPDWAYADLGTMAAGGVTVPVYHTEGAAAALHILKDSGSRFLFIASRQLAEQLVTEHADELALEKLILLEGSCDAERVLDIEAFRHLGDAPADRTLQQRLAAGRGDDLATLIYTSGTTGLPKGVMLTHRGILTNVAACAERFPVGPGDQCLSFLPLSHVFERVDGYYFMLLQGATIAYAENIESVPVNLQEVGPTLAISVPRLFEKMYARVMDRVLTGPWLKKQIFFSALGVCRKYLQEQQAGRQPSGLVTAAAGLARKKIFAKLGQALGGNLKFFISGGAPLPPAIGEFFHAVGLPIYEGYGMTETGAGITVNTPEAFKLGTVGPAVPGIELKIAEDGEILVRGEGVCKGYWDKPEVTDAAIVDGWLHTGDIGVIDADGFLKITDRKKDLIITAGGENIAPQLIENRFKTDKFIANAFVYGDRRPFLTALLVPNFDNLENYARLKNLAHLNHCDLVNHPQVLDLIRRRIDRLQQGSPSFQHIKRFTLLSADFAGDEITPTMKLRRKVVKEHFASTIEQMYEAKDHGRHDVGFCVVETGSAAGPDPDS